MNIYKNYVLDKIIVFLCVVGITTQAQGMEQDLNLKKSVDLTTTNSIHYPDKVLLFLKCIERYNKGIRIAIPSDVSRYIVNFLSSSLIRDTLDCNFEHFQIQTLDGSKGSFSADGTKVLTRSVDGKARLWDTQTGKEIKIFSHPDPVYSVAFSADGSTILTGSAAGKAYLWDTQTGEEIKIFNPHDDCINSVAFSANGTKILTGSADGKARLWDTQTGEEIKTFTHFLAVTSVALSPDGTKVLTRSADEKARLWDTQTGKKIKIFNPHDDILSVALSLDGSTILTGSINGKVCLWDIQTGKEIKSFNNPDPVHSVALSPDGTKVLTGSCEKTAHLWDIQTGQLLTILSHPGYVTSVAFSSDGKIILTQLCSGQACLWKVKSCKATKWMLESANPNQTQFIKKTSQEKKTYETFSLDINSPDYQIFITMPDYVQEYLKKWYKVTPVDCKKWYNLLSTSSNRIVSETTSSDQLWIFTAISNNTETIGRKAETIPQNLLSTLLHSSSITTTPSNLTAIEIKIETTSNNSSIYQTNSSSETAPQSLISPYSGTTVSKDSTPKSQQQLIQTTSDNSSFLSPVIAAAGISGLSILIYKKCFHQLSEKKKISAKKKLSEKKEKTKKEKDPKEAIPLEVRLIGSVGVIPVP